MKLYIKYMVSLRCKTAVESALKQLGILFTSIDLGIVEPAEELTPAQRQTLKETLFHAGLELLDDKKSILIEKIKAVTIEMIRHYEQRLNANDSKYIAEKLGYTFTYLSKLFSEVKGVTLQHFIILHKIERVKELLLNDKITLTEIAYRLHYSSKGHLSNRFKKVTGVSPLDFKKLHRKSGDKLENR